MLDDHVKLLKELKLPFPEDQVREREGNKRKNPDTGKWEPQYFKYIPTNYVTERLDEVMGLNWSWEVLETKIYPVNKQVYNKETKETVLKEVTHVAALGRLTLRLFIPETKDHYSVFRDAWGGCELDKGGQAGDCFKIADSNAFKKAAYKFGVGAYLGIEALENSDIREDLKENIKTKGRVNFKNNNENTNPFLA